MVGGSRLLVVGQFVILSEAKVLKMRYTVPF